ncbi:MAG: T9SS type A sorting domain-containing protein [Cyclobacteriaceae bacterium]
MIVFTNGSQITLKITNKIKNPEVRIYSLNGTLIGNFLNVRFSQNESKIPFKQRGLFLLILKSDEKVYVERFINK